MRACYFAIARLNAAAAEYPLEQPARTGMINPQIGLYDGPAPLEYAEVALLCTSLIIPLNLFQDV